MSCNEKKVVLRAEFPQLQGKNRTEVFPFYKEILGVPSELDEYEGEVEYFEYEGKYQSAYDYNNKRWGIDWVLHHESDYKTYIEMRTNGVSLGDFEKMASAMSQIFGVDKSKVRLISYTWYNGVDEPIKFD
ncbi:hypothetical protein [Cytobacillus firmus]|uniref:hypothetical protein n=1 Tax=Cytobacillus firmus TaxID=1399 RepID=UPI0018CDDF3E|nr:hypothetical protein [Cytobacillus firmus]MBG9549752.1 hypothetical protein [Cytobacillus firmus]MBG9603126.1 hypothetical protein [Cytobacillus firmus]MED1942078.1 hypothetical protein [Cytobacillus firmus]